MTATLHAPIGGQERPDLLQHVLRDHLWVALDGQHPVLEAPDLIGGCLGGCQQLSAFWQLKDLQHEQHAIARALSFRHASGFQGTCEAGAQESIANMLCVRAGRCSPDHHGFPIL